MFRRPKSTSANNDATLTPNNDINDSIKSMPNDYTSMIMNMVYVESFLPSSLGTSHFFHCS